MNRRRVLGAAAGLAVLLLVRPSAPGPDEWRRHLEREASEVKIRRAEGAWEFFVYRSYGERGSLLGQHVIVTDRVMSRVGQRGMEACARLVRQAFERKEQECAWTWADAPKRCTDASGLDRSVGSTLLT